MQKHKILNNELYDRIRLNKHSIKKAYMFLLNLSPLSGNFALYLNLNRDTLYFPCGMQSISLNPIDIFYGY